MVRPDSSGLTVAPRWLDRPRGEAFWISVDRLPDNEAPSWPSWLAPTEPVLGRSGASRRIPSSHAPARRVSTDPRSSSGNPAPART